MPSCPLYRVRLFLSVDLVGSTAFKARVGDDPDKDGLYPVWLDRTKSFYRDFPRMLGGNCGSQHQVVLNAKEFELSIPKVWKTVGDEIIFCVTLKCIEHLAVCYNAFVQTLSEYGKNLSLVQSELDVKGSAWVAVFPSPNVTISSASKIIREASSGTSQPPGGEDQEKEADSIPGDFDFLGKNIDTGFRIAKFAQAHQMALSIELAWLLTLAKHHQLVAANFTYHGREELKGVLNGNPYPVVTSETERDHTKRRLRDLEMAIGKSQIANNIALSDYLYAFMQNHKVDIPIVPMYGETPDGNSYPQSYRDFVVAWERRQQEDEMRDRAIDGASSGDAEDQAPPTPTVEFEEFIDKLVKRMSAIIEANRDKNE